MRRLARDRAVVAVLLLVAFLVDLVLTPGHYSPIVFAIPILFAAHFLSPRDTVVTCVVALSLAVAEAVLHADPLATKLVVLPALVIVAVTGYLLSARIKSIQDRDMAQREALAAVLRVRDRILALAHGESHGEADIGSAPPPFRSGGRARKSRTRSTRCLRTSPTANERKRRDTGWSSSARSTSTSSPTTYARR